jgi:hypothetical protein
LKHYEKGILHCTLINYIGDKTIRVGVMADEVEQKYPGGSDQCLKAATKRLITGN